MTSSLFRWAALCTQDVVQEKMFSWSNNLDIFFSHFALSLNNHLPQLPLAFACARHTQDILGAEQAMQVNFMNLK